MAAKKMTDIHSTGDSATSRSFSHSYVLMIGLEAVHLCPASPSRRGLLDQAPLS